MTFSARSAALCSITLAGLLALSACGKNEQQSPSQPAAPSTAPAPASTAAKPAPSTTAAAPAATGTAAAAATAPAAASTSAAATSAAAAGFQVSSVTLGDALNGDHKVKKEVSSFSPSQKTLYVSVDTTGSTPGATLNAKWTYLDKNQTIVSTSQSIVADSPSTTTFSMKNPDLWPEGKYKVDVSLDGKQVASKTFEVKKG
jgi:pyruvate/2-oxoglutarate dehydrogenase complex dihydrolipoamide acyltransferase (E2) component